MEVELDLSRDTKVRVFPFFSSGCDDDNPYEVIMHHDGENHDADEMNMTPDEADRLADMLKAAAAFAREQNAKERT